MSVVNIENMTVIVSDRDKNIVRLLADGRRAPQIAESISMNIRTLESNINRMKLIYGCDTREQLVAFFLRNKIIE